MGFFKNKMKSIKSFHKDLYDEIESSHEIFWHDCKNHKDKLRNHPDYKTYIETITEIPKNIVAHFLSFYIEKEYDGFENISYIMVKKGISDRLTDNLINNVIGFSILQNSWTLKNIKMLEEDFKYHSFDEAIYDYLPEDSCNIFENI